MLHRGLLAAESSVHPPPQRPALPPRSDMAVSVTEGSPETSAIAPRSVSARWVMRLLTWLAWILVGAALTLAGAYLLLRHWIWPDIDRWRPQIETVLSGLVDAPVSIGELSSGFDGLRPSLRARAIRVGQGADAPLAIEQAYAVVSLRSLLRGSPSLIALELELPVIRVERIDRRRFAVAGALVDFDQPGRSTELALVLASRSFSVRNARLDWHDRMGSEPMVVAGVELLSTFEDGRHHVSLRVPGIGQGVQGLEFALDFRAPEEADPTDWRLWQGEAYLSATQLQFAPLARTLRGWLSPGDLSQQTILAGSGPIKTWLGFKQGRIDDLLVKAFTETIDLSIAGRRLALRSFSLEAGAQHSGENTLRVSPRRISAVDAEGFLFALDERASQRIELDLRTLQPRSGHLVWRGFDGARLLDTARRLPLRDEWIKSLARLSIGGRITSAGVRWDDGGERYAVSLAFDRLSVRRAPDRTSRAPDNLPSFANLTGVAEFDHLGGKVQLDSTSAVLRFPGVFADPVLQFASLQGGLAWSLDSGGPSPILELRAEGLSFSSADMAGEVSGSWRSTGRSTRGEIDLTASLERANAARVARYLPLVVDPAVRAWVSRAINTGNVGASRFRLRGDLADFPFRDPAQGEFRIESQFDQLTLAHTPGWPAIERIQGSLVFDRAAMQIDAAGADLLGVRLEPVRAGISELSQPVLRIAGDARGELQDMLRFVENSPLRTRVPEAMRAWRLGGEANLGLNLDIGLARGGKAEYRGRLDLRDNQLAVDPALPGLESVGGQVVFDATGVRSVEPLQARLLGGPSRWRFEAPASGGLTLSAEGDASARMLLAQGGAHWAERAAGEIPWRGSLEFDSSKVSARLESDLVGTTLNLPAPMAKQPGERWPLRVDWVRALGSPAAASESVSLRLRSDLRMRAERPASGTHSAWRGAIALGVDPLIPAQGLALDLRLPALDGDAWLELLDPKDVPTKPAGTAATISRASLLAESLSFGGKEFNSVVLGASVKEGRWRASISAREI